MSTRWRMRFVSLVVLLVSMAPLSILCQSVQDELNSSFKGKTLLLRNFYAGDDLGYDQSGVLHGQVVQGPWTLANVEIKEIAVATQSIEIVANRMGIWYRDGKPSFVKVGKVNIHITKPILGADTETTLHSLFDKIFIESGENIRPLVPGYWQSYLDGSDPKSRLASWNATLDREYPPITKLGTQPSAITAPRPLFTPDPRYTREGAKHYIEGVSRLGIVVDGTGKADDIAILEPLGMGLDDQAVLAVKQWRFQPAMKNGQPVRVQIHVDIKFRCCP